MKTFLTVLLVLAMLATLGVLLIGVVGMIRGGDPRRSNRMMRMRVVLQGVALAVLAVLLLMLKN
ncbi:MAG: twin transmembrane helix small protein [Rhodospirillales bacterium]